MFRISLFFLKCFYDKMHIYLIVLLLFTASCVHQRHPHFYWPVQPPFHISRKFSIYHEGIDFPKRKGHPVYAIAPGKVIYTGHQFSGYGKMILIQHSPYWSSLYAHLHHINTKMGQRVKQRQKIGSVGSTGRSTAPHLHFELMYNKQPLNPVPFLLKRYRRK